MRRRHCSSGCSRPLILLPRPTLLMMLSLILVPRSDVHATSRHAATPESSNPTCRPLYLPGSHRAHCTMCCTMRHCCTAASPAVTSGSHRRYLPALLPGRPVVANTCVTHPLGASAVKATARDTGATARAKDRQKRDKYGRTGRCVTRDCVQEDCVEECHARPVLGPVPSVPWDHAASPRSSPRSSSRSSPRYCAEACPPERTPCGCGVGRFER